jgi:hypothetical protein
MKVHTRIDGRKIRVHVYNGTINPPPSTKRGKRPHERRSPEEQRRAQFAWYRNSDAA